MTLDKNKTMIEVFRKTTKRLNKKKITKRESYDEVINRTLDKTEDEK